MGFPSQEYWSGLPFPSSGHLPDPGIEPTSPSSPAFAGRFFNTEPFSLKTKTVVSKLNPVSQRTWLSFAANRFFSKTMPNSVTKDPSL